MERHSSTVCLALSSRNDGADHTVRASRKLHNWRYGIIWCRSCADRSTWIDWWLVVNVCIISFAAASWWMFYYFESDTVVTPLSLFRLSPLTTFVSTFFLAEAFKLWKRVSSNRICTVFHVIISLTLMFTPFLCLQSFIVSYWLLLLFENLTCISQSLDLFCVFFAWLTLPCTYHLLTLGTTRGIQGRFNDISLILAINAARNESDGKLTEGAIAALDDVARIQTLMHQLFWCV